MGKVGRPKGTDNKETVISMRMNGSMLKRLEAYCKKMNIGKSEALRKALIELMDKENQEENQRENGTLI